ncbi:putative testis-specific Y-encoded-like protein 3 isoform X2 [Myxocyprinus asiaticus]|uniref:putative testis-specific Y-encoded-like protein 3 isoform X2 n=1 Tax=Myxocyprinus asiaticus TaxID=70543 RepID=UPI0022223C3B|nr:putative testis-specific Y-encoded-like protein 3 isoform X2 [Myxocyprinus asiaticus]
MSTDSESSKPSEINQRKRSANPSKECDSGLPKQAKVSDEEPIEKQSDGGVEPGKVGNGEPEHGGKLPEAAAERVSLQIGEREFQSSASSREEPSDPAAIAAAEALASLTGGDGDDDSKEMPCSSSQVRREKSKDKSSRPSYTKGSERRAQPTEAAAADSSSSLLNCEDRENPEQAMFLNDDDEEEEEDDDDSLTGSSSTASSSAASDNEDNEDGECAIVSVKMAPEVRQSVALLAQVQMRLDALVKKNARLHQRLEMKLSRQRRPHLDQRSAIIQAIPGFWVTALLNHPHLSAHIDETDEDALSYMINLEIESFKNNKLGYRISFHFRRNPFFQNKVIMKELHLGVEGSSVSFSNPILWHRGQNLVGSGEPRRTSQGVYQSFFHWFSDHTNPGRDEIAQILKEDLYRNPLRYYLTPLWEPRENGSAPKLQSSNNGDECVIISDSDEDQEESNSQNLNQGQEEEDDDQVGGSEENDREEGESSYEEREEVDIEEVDVSRDSTGCEVLFEISSTNYIN